MSTNTRTVAQAHARIDALDAKLDLILAALDANAPAKTAPKAPAKKAAPKARKAAPKKAATPKVTKGATGYRTGAGMTRQAWNKTLATKARFAGGDTYRRVMADWAEVQTLRNAGVTPDEALALYTK